MCKLCPNARRGAMTRRGAFANDKKIRVVGSVYELKTGRVRLLG